MTINHFLVCTESAVSICKIHNYCSLGRTKEVVSSKTRSFWYSNSSRLRLLSRIWIEAVLFLVYICSELSSCHFPAHYSHSFSRLGPWTFLHTSWMQPVAAYDEPPCYFVICIILAVNAGHFCLPVVTIIMIWRMYVNISFCFIF